jgi:hypothetical protein
MNNLESNQQTRESDNLEPELKQYLAQWKAPVAPERLDSLVRASYRKQILQPPWWLRWLSVSIRIPLPVAVSAGLVLCVMFWVAGRRTSSFVIQPAADTPLTKIIEVPVIQEKLITRIIFRQPKHSRQGLKVVSAPPSHRSPEGNDVGFPIDLAGLRPVGEIKITVSHGGKLQ